MDTLISAIFPFPFHIFCFWLEILPLLEILLFTFLDRLGPKSQNCYFKLKFGTSTNSNKQNSMVISVHFWLKILFFYKLGWKNQNCQFKLKFVTKTNPSMKNSMVVFAFSFLDCKCRLWANLVRNIKIVSLSWNLVTRLIRICRIQWRC